MPDPLPPEALLAHAHFVRRLAGSLVRGDADADDAAQETLARALREAPEDPERTRPWLVRTLRNVVARGHRDRGRRARRELAAARPEGTLGAADLVARDETLRSVVEAVASLDAPHRAVVLLRHYDGLPPREIAARLGEPVETIKSRLKRAHERLRERLDRAERPGKGTWRAVLSAFAGAPVPGAGSGAGAGGVGGGGAAAIGGAMAIGVGAKAGLAAAAVLLLAGATWGILAASSNSSTREAEAPPPLAKADPGAAPPPSDPAALAAKPAGAAGSRPAVATAPKERPVADGWTRVDLARAVIDVPATWTLADSDRSQGTASWYVGSSDRNAKLMAGMQRPNAKGLERLRSQLTPEEERPVTVDGRPATFARGKSPKVPGGTIWMVTLDAAEPDGTTYAWLVSMREGNVGEMARNVEDLLGSVRFVAIPVLLPEATAAELQTARGTLTPVDVLEVVVLGGSKGVGWRATLHPEPSSPTDPAPGPTPSPQQVGADGVARFAGVPAGPWAVTLSSPEGVERPFVGPIQVGRNALGNGRLVVGLGTATLEGKVFGREGVPLANHPFRLVRSRDISDAPIVVRTDAEGRYRVAELRSAGYQFRDVLVARDGRELDVREGFVSVAPGDQQTLDLGSAKPEPLWTGAVRLASGTPFHGPSTLALVSAVRAASHTITLEDPGRGSLRVPAGAYHVFVSPSGLMKSPPALTWTVPDKDFTQDLTVPGVRVQGVLRDGAAGRPFPLVERRSMPSVELTSSEGAAAGPVGIGSPGADGSFVIDGVPPGRYRVTAAPPYGREGKGASLDVVVPADHDVAGIDLDLTLR